MANYVYGCTEDKSHPRKEVSHGMKENPVVLCDKCGAKMARVPQPFRFSFNATEVLLEYMDHNYRIMRKHPKDYRKRMFSPDLVKRPGKPIPGTQSDYRKVKPNAN